MQLVGTAFQRIISCLKQHALQPNEEQEHLHEGQEGEEKMRTPSSFAFLIDLLENKWLQALLTIYCQLDEFNRDVRHCSVEVNSESLAEEVRSSLSEEWMSEAQDLCRTLSSPHLKALLSACQTIARQDYYPALPLDALQDDVSYENSATESEFELESIKIVQVIKNNEPLGATVKIEDQGQVIIVRVIFGGAAFRSGLIQVGDQIYDVNGYELRGRAPEETIHLLERECRKSTISFKLIPGNYAGCGRGNEGVSRTSRVRVRAHFDYSPFLDPYHPCPEAGLTFKRRDVLHVVNQDDVNWWQARKESDATCASSSNGWLSACSSSTRAGIIPGLQLQERRFAAMRDLKSECGSIQLIEIVPGYRSPFKRDFCGGGRRTKKIMYTLEESHQFDRQEIVVYEEVAKLYPTPGIFRPIVLIGAPGVGRNELIRHLVSLEPDFYRRPVGHTSRPSKEWEVDGSEYYFVDREWMDIEIQLGHFLEHGEYKGNFYGTHAETVSSLISAGYVCVLSPHPQALKVIYSQHFKPFIVFIKPPYDLNRLQYTRNKRNARTDLEKNVSRKFTDKEFTDMIINSHKLERIYGHYFDVIIVNDDLNLAFQQLVSSVKRAENEPQWAPAGWF